MNHVFRITLMSAACVMATAYAADLAPRHHPSPPATDAGARVATPTYKSAFTGYQRYQAQATVPWRDLNDAAHEAGGHIGIVRGNAGTVDSSHRAGHPK